MKRRSDLKIMIQLVGLIKPLIPIMIAAILFGTLGYLCAISLTIIASYSLLNLDSSWFIVLLILAILRGILHYIEQYCNHFIAFKLLALIRNQVFTVLRKLCPAKLDGRDKGNLISIITTDIELLEVFYAHTISPIFIAILTSLVMVLFIGQFNLYATLLAIVAYITIGVIVPLVNGKHGSLLGTRFRNKFGDLNSFILDALRGLDETIQYDQRESQLNKLKERSIELESVQRKLNNLEGKQRSYTNLLILVFSFMMLYLTMFLELSSSEVLLCTVAMMGSFGSVVALSNLSNNLNQTLASGNRVLSLLEEEPVVKNNFEGFQIQELDSIDIKDIDFAYGSENIFSNFTVSIKPNKITGIYGPSGCGKSTILKLLMRFWDVDKGEILISEENIKKIKTSELRNLESFVTQDTHLFHDTIANNIAVAKIGAHRDEIIQAAKKASIHDFIMSLPNGYDTQVGELGDTLSGGEKQRIGIARAFLHDAQFVLLDEPTSNLDALNEGIILKSLKEEQENKTIILVSHRKSTMSITDQMISVEN